MRDENKPHRPVTLSPADAEALDALLEAMVRGDQAARRQLEEADRGRAVSQWLELIDRWPADPPADDLVARTMARVRDAGRQHEVVARIDEARMDVGPTGAIAFRWSELIAVAATLLIAVSLLWPMLARSRSDAMRVACAANLNAAGMSMRSYAADNGRILPRYASQPGASWWNVGQPFENGFVQSNSANLYKLRRTGYADLKSLTCPTNGETASQLAASAFDWPSPRSISYSYQNQFTAEPTRVERNPGIVVLADKNPLFTAAAGDSSQLTFDANRDLSAPGHRHTDAGQSALILDGRVIWTKSPVINGDNFYTAQGVTKYTGTETPTATSDSFLVP